MCYYGRGGIWGTHVLGEGRVVLAHPCFSRGRQLIQHLGTPFLPDCGAGAPVPQVTGWTSSLPRCHGKRMP